MASTACSSANSAIHRRTVGCSPASHSRRTPWRSPDCRPRTSNTRCSARWATNLTSALKRVCRPALFAGQGNVYRRGDRLFRRQRTARLPGYSDCQRDHAEIFAHLWRQSGRQRVRHDFQKASGSGGAGEFVPSTICGQRSRAVRADETRRLATVSDSLWSYEAGTKGRLPRPSPDFQHFRLLHRLEGHSADCQFCRLAATRSQRTWAMPRATAAKSTSPPRRRRIGP